MSKIKKPAPVEKKVEKPKKPKVGKAVTEALTSTFEQHGTVVTDNVMKLCVDIFNKALVIAAKSVENTEKESAEEIANEVKALSVPADYLSAFYAEQQGEEEEEPEESEDDEEEEEVEDDEEEEETEDDEEEEEEEEEEEKPKKKMLKNPDKAKPAASDKKKKKVADDDDDDDEF